MLIQDIPDVCFSSQLRHIECAADYDVLNVRVTDTDLKWIYSNTLHAFSGSFSIYELDDILESEMRARGVSSIAVIVTFRRPLVIGESQGEVVASKSFNVIFSRACPFFNSSPEQWLEENFLSLSQARRCPPGMAPSVSAFLAPGEVDSPTYSVSYELEASGEKGSLDFSMLSFPGQSARVRKFDFSYDRLMANLALKGIALRDVRILSVSVSVGRRSMLFFFDEELEGQPVFEFSNNFNAPDFICLPGQLTESQTVSFSSASILGATVQYDRNTEISFKVSWPALDFDSIPAVRDFFASERIGIINFTDGFRAADDGVSMPVIISDSKFECDAFESLNSAEFTFRFSDNRPVVAALNSHAPRVFDSSHNLSFS